MIAENDLRVGNFILKGREIFKVTSVGAGNMALSVDCFGCVLGHKLEDCDGVHLTPEIIVKAEFVGEQFGFENCKYTNGFVNVFFNHQYKSTFFKYYEQGEKKVYRVLEYVHQLQNLYHALTGKELEINL